MQPRSQAVTKNQNAIYSNNVHDNSIHATLRNNHFQNEAGGGILSIEFCTEEIAVMGGPVDDAWMNACVGAWI